MNTILKMNEEKESIKISQIALALEELESNSIKLQRERVQSNIMQMAQLKHYRRVYIEMFEMFTKTVVFITELLEKISRRIVIGQSFTLEKITSDVNEFVSHIIKTVDDNNEYMKEKAKNMTYFEFYGDESPMHVALEPLFVCGDIGDKRKLLQKLALLDQLQSQIPNRRNGSSYERDMEMIDLKNKAEKYFI